MNHLSYELFKAFMRTLFITGLLLSIYFIVNDINGPGEVLGFMIAVGIFFGWFDFEE